MKEEDLDRVLVLRRKLDALRGRCKAASSPIDTLTIEALIRPNPKVVGQREILCTTLGDVVLSQEAMREIVNIVREDLAQQITVIEQTLRGLGLEAARRH